MAFPARGSISSNRVFPEAEQERKTALDRALRRLSMNAVSFAFRRPDDPNLDGGAPPGGAPGPEPSLATVDQQAMERLHRLASGEEIPSKPEVPPYDCNDFRDSDRHDFDRCLTEKIPNPVLFTPDAAGKTMPRVEQVMQGRVGDCFLMASLAALVSSESRTLIHDAIVENRNAKGEVVSYSVTLYKRETHWLRDDSFEKVKITVDPLFPVGHAIARAAASGSPASATHAMWSVVMERAFAVYTGTYNKLNQGGTPRGALEALTGKPGFTVSLGDYGYRTDQLESDLAAHKPLILSSKAGLPNESGDIVARHAYQITGSEMQGNTLCVTLRDPTGALEPKPVPFVDLAKWFDNVTVGSKP
jgi:hypothetical protein